MFTDVDSEGEFVTALVHLPEAIGDVKIFLPHSRVIQSQDIRKIYEAVIQLYDERREITRISVARQVGINGDFAAVKRSGLSLVFSEDTPSTHEAVMQTAEHLLSMYRRAEAFNAVTMTNAALGGDATDQEISEAVFKIYESMTIHGGRTYEKTSKQAADGALAMIDAAIKRKKNGGVSGIPTGSNKLDRELGGWQKDEVIILAGRPGMGKTAAALDFVLHAAKQGYPVGVFSMEMDSENLNFRLAAAETGIKYSEMIKGNISDEEWVRIETALCEIGKLPIYYYDDVSAQQMEVLDAMATEWCRQYNIQMIMIDYIQYLEVKLRGSNYEKITAVSKAVKRLQRKLKIPILALAQLSRDVEKRPDPRPIMEDLKESGQLEQDASTIIGLFDPAYYERKGRQMFDELEIGEIAYPPHTYCYYLLKRRSGGHARVDRYADIPTNRFSDTNIFIQPDMFGSGYGYGNRPIF